MSSGSCGKTHPCRYCTAVFGGKATRWRHERTHVPSDASSCFRCRVCGDVFLYLACFERHVRKHDDRSDALVPLADGVQCERCDASFPRYIEWYVHTRAHLRTEYG